MLEKNSWASGRVLSCIYVEGTWVDLFMFSPLASFLILLFRLGERTCGCDPFNCEYLLTLVSS